MVAAELGARRRDDGLAAVFTSDLDRAVETARIAFAGTEIPVFKDARLRECDYGELNGQRIADFPSPRSQFVDRPFPGGQSYHQVVEDTRDFLSDLAAAWDGKRALLIAHSANRYMPYACCWAGPRSRTRLTRRSAGSPVGNSRSMRNY